jgi:hypothetical protein
MFNLIKRQFEAFDAAQLSGESYRLRFPLRLLVYFSLGRAMVKYYDRLASSAQYARELHAKRLAEYQRQLDCDADYRRVRETIKRLEIKW